jgi:hypothetical protein
MKQCKLCLKDIAPKKNANNVIYCSLFCRNDDQREKNGLKSRLWRENKVKQYEEGKLQCLICEGWYWKVGGHVWNKHKILTKNYQDIHGLEHKGLIPVEHKKYLAKLVEKNYDLVVAKNLLEQGVKTRFEKGCGNNYKRKDITLQRVAQLGGKKKNAILTATATDVHNLCGKVDCTCDNDYETERDSNPEVWRG